MLLGGGLRLLPRRRRRGALPAQVPPPAQRAGLQEALTTLFQSGPPHHPSVLTPRCRVSMGPPCCPGLT